MDYYFVIAGIKIRISSSFQILWNDYIQRFRVPACEEYDEYYECICVDEFPVEGKLIYQNQWQWIFRNGNREERLHFFWGQTEPCMLYKECEAHKVIYLNKRYMESFLREDNYCIFNALALEKVLIKHQAIVLHSSFVVWKNQAILFTAPSGTGKSTQASLWEMHQKAIIANGDRTILKEKDGRLYAYGMPVCGSSDICLNVEVPVKAIVYLSQAPENKIEDIELKHKIKLLISETTINFFDERFLDQATDLIMQMSEKVDMYHLSCRKDQEAVEVLRNKLEGNIYESD